jgi:hypothetical protein
MQAFLCPMRQRQPTLFKYVIGSFVKLAQGAPMQRVIWRGKQVVPNIIGKPHEAPVYRLDDDYWDCYYEHQLHPALTQAEEAPPRRRRRGF